MHLCPGLNFSSKWFMGSLPAIEAKLCKAQHFFSEYETGAIEGVEEDEIEDDGALSAETTEPPIKRGRGRPPKAVTEAATPTAPGSVAANLSGPMQQMLMKMGLLPSMIFLSREIGKQFIQNGSFQSYKFSNKRPPCFS